MMLAFRSRGRNVQLLRSSGADDGEDAAEVLGTVKPPDYLPDPAVAARLSPDELEEVARLGARRARADKVAREHAACALAESIRLATDWLKAAEAEEALAFVEEVRLPFARLRRLVAKIALNEEDEADE